MIFCRPFQAWRAKWLGMPAAVLAVAVVAALAGPTVRAQAADGDGGDAANSAQAEAYRAAAASVEADLEEALAELAKQRAAIAAQKVPLARETAAIEAEWREKTRQATLASQGRDALVHDLKRLADRVRLWEDESAYIEGLLLEYRKEFEADSTLATAEKLREALRSAEVPGTSGLDARLRLLQTSIGHLADRHGAARFSGQALDAEGVARDGTFVEAGPVSWFVTDDGDAAGLVSERSGLQPEMLPGTVSADTMRRFLDGESVDLPFDPTMGKALALREEERSFFDHVRDGGVWIYPILALALVAMVAAVAKWVQLARIRPFAPSIVRDLLRHLNAGDEARAREVAASLRHPARGLLERGIELRDRRRDEIEEALYERYLEVQPGLQRGLSLIAIAAATAPLLGLLGTVTGMIHTFKLINIFGTGDAKSLASGISEALVTTEFGLAVAIPALIMHALLSRKVQGLRSTLEMTSLAFVNGVESAGEGRATTGKTETGGRSR